MADLLCAEKLVDRLAEADPVIFGDRRVLDILLQSEKYYIPKFNYFHFQTDLKPFMRKVVASWMMEVSYLFLLLFDAYLPYIYVCIELNALCLLCSNATLVQ